MCWNWSGYFLSFGIVYSRYCSGLMMRLLMNELIFSTREVKPFYTKRLSLSRKRNARWCHEHTNYQFEGFIWNSRCEESPFDRNSSIEHSSCSWRAFDWQARKRCQDFLAIQNKRSFVSCGVSKISDPRFQAGCCCITQLGYFGPTRLALILLGTSFSILTFLARCFLWNILTHFNAQRLSDASSPAWRKTYVPRKSRTETTREV